MKIRGPIEEALEEYMEGRAELYTTKKKARSLIDMATLAVKELRHAGGLTNLDESDEINACTIIVPVDVDGKTEEWLLLFKNETHNHPTEIEPFGGAATVSYTHLIKIALDFTCFTSFHANSRAFHCSSIGCTFVTTL